MKALPLEHAVLPRSGILSFGNRRSATHVHRGVDLPRPEGTNVFAVADGTVEHASAAWERGFGGYGGHVVIAHSDGTRALYAHLSAVAVAKGLRVLAGEIVGRVGRTAFTNADHSALLDSGPHLHFEISPRAYPQSSEAERIDPVAWLAGAVAPRVARALAIVARASGLDVALLRAVSWVQSKWDATAESSTGAIGLFGFSAQQAAALHIDAKDPEAAAAAAATVLKRALASFGETAAALAAFAWGFDNVQQHPSSNGWPAAVELWVREVLGRYADERAALGAFPLGPRGAAVGSP